ncbi:hypothetical protein BpHYR1_005875 [Brachionus plicatilis]|uniref:Uncharacterized protein n=1 Tax=Brachionus plicatilis TaxID=10195 RepID=A0A3M7T9K9_BRAPC|nr:hypothetical protein BpHYR1_005875 [Brachionus plicatilis]
MLLYVIILEINSDRAEILQKNKKFPLSNELNKLELKIDILKHDEVCDTSALNPFSILTVRIGDHTCSYAVLTKLRIKQSSREVKR